MSEIKSQNLNTSFIRTVFEKVHDRGVNYVVLRNYENLPEQAGHDIDILVHPDQITAFEEQMLAAARETNWFLLRKEKRYAFLSYTFGCLMGEPTLQLLKWDFWYPITWKGIPWIEFDAILRDSRKYNGLCVPSAGSEAALLCLKDVIQVGQIREKYYQRIDELARQDAEGFKKVLLRYWGREAVNWLLGKIQHQAWQEIETEFPKLRRVLVSRIWRSNPLGVVKRLYKFILGHLQTRLRSRAGLFICFIGPDGSGKSTISNQVTKAVEPLFVETRYYHGRFGILPDLKDLLRLRMSDSNRPTGEVAPESVKKAPSQWRVFLYLTYYGIDYLLGHLLVAQAHANPRLLVFDRYFYDYVLQPGFLDANHPLFKFWLRLIPKPDQVFYLRAPAELVHQRKPELSVQEIARQEEACVALANLLSNCEIIDNSGALDDSVGAIVSHIMAKVAASYTSR